MRRDRLRDGKEPVAMRGRPGIVCRLTNPLIAGAFVAAFGLGSGCTSQKAASKTATDTAAPPPPAGSVAGSTASGSTSGSTNGSTTGSSTTSGSTASTAGTPVEGDAGLLPPPPPPPDQAPPSGAVLTTEGWTTPAPERQVSGYRLQIFATSDRQRAEETAAGARKSFAEPIYVEYEAPLYKVRIGDCATRQEAEALKEKASLQGYDGSWIAETMVTAR